MPAPSTGPGGLRLDATRVMSGHDDPGMRRRPDPHPRQRPGDSMPAGVHAAPERRRWCRGGGGGGRRGGCRVHGRAGRRSRAAASGSSQAYASNHGNNNDPLQAYSDRISHEVPPRADGGGGSDRGGSAGHSVLRMRGAVGSFRSGALEYGIRPVTCEFPELGGVRVLIGQTRSASSAAVLIFGTQVDHRGGLRVRAGLCPGCRLGFAVPVSGTGPCGR
jgi:hypothetical protein